METYRWPRINQFLDRASELEQLEQWWTSGKWPLNMHGRRRVGKTWLLRRFAHEKPATILVAEQSATGPMLARFARTLEPAIGFRPDIPDVATLFRTLFRLGQQGRMLAVIDEFPLLLGHTASDWSATLSGIQAAMEDEGDGSQLKLILCGSAIDQMERLSGSTIAGRLQPFPVLPLSFAAGRRFLASLPAQEQMLRFAIAGGSPLYLDALKEGPLDKTLTDTFVSPRSAYFDEPRHQLASELREPATYMSILGSLATKPQELARIANAMKVPTASVTPHLERLRELRLVRRLVPAGAAANNRQGLYSLEDSFFRFWFRFVQPAQADLEAGSDPGAYTKGMVLPHLHEHASWTFEDLVRQWVRRRWSAQVSSVSAWWGKAPSRRDTPNEGGEEVDAVGLSSKQVVVVGEAKWSNRIVGVDLLDAILTHKIPALALSGFKVDPRPEIVLASRSGFSVALQQRADADGHVHLMSGDVLLSELA